MPMKIKVFLYCILAMLTLTSCHTIHPTHPTSTQETDLILKQAILNNQGKHKPASAPHLPSGVDSALLPPLSHYVKQRTEEAHFDVAANKVPAKEFFVGLVAGTSQNMVVHPDISGTISLTLKNVTIKQAMQAVRDVYGYEYHQTSYGYEVLPPTLGTQLFYLNYLDVQRTGKSYTQLTTGQVSNKVGTVTVGGLSSTGGITSPAQSSVPEGIGTISSIETKSEMQFWKDIEKTLINIVGTDNGRSVVVNAQTGVIAVHAFPAELHRVQHYINSLQRSLNRQVILEAKIVEVQLDDRFQAGIDWSILGNPGLIDPTTGLPSTQAGMGQAANNLFNNTELKALTQAGVFAIRVNGNFKLLINLLQTQGNVQVLSSPHISTVNNQKAVIKVGQDEFFVTGVSTSNTIIGTNTIPSQDVSLTPFFSGITLDVTPEISDDQTVVLHIHPSVSKVTEQTKVVGLGSNSNGTPNNLTLPLAFSTIRESDNIVRAKNGQVIVIGGLMQNNMIETLAETPGMSKVPFLGSLFRRTMQTSSKSELVILLRPIVANNKTFTQSLEQERKTFTVLRRPFHAGGLPKVFGNEAERDDNE